MTEYMFNQLVDIDQVRKLLQSHHILSGMAYSMRDAVGNILIAVGCQDICVRFHRANPVTLSRCCESDNYINTRLRDLDEGYSIEYRCKNGMMDVAIPININGRHVGTFFTGQFFYDDERPDTEFFRTQAEEFGFDSEEYFQALALVPVFSREYVRRNLLFLCNMVLILAETGLKNLRFALDTKERRRTGKRLILMNFALNHIREAAYLIDEQGRFKYVNNEACVVLGYSSNELLASCVADVDPDFPAEHWPAHWCDIKSRGSLVIERRHKTREGRVFPVEIYATYFEFEGQGYHLALARDITERKQMETALRESEQQFRTLTENSPNIIMRYDRECSRVYVNPTYTRETGIAAELVLNLTLEKKWTDVTNMTAKKYKSKLQQVMQTGVPAEILLEWQRQDTGQVVSHIFNVVAEKDLDDNITGCLAIGHNITGLREAESRLAKLAETAPGAMFNFLLKPDGTSCMPYISARVKAYGLRPDVMAEDLSEAFDLIHPGDIVRVRKSISESSRTLSSWHSEFRVLHQANGEVWVEGRGTPEFQPNGGILWSGFFHDITERKLTEISLIAKKEQLASMAIDLSLAEERERRRIASELHDHIGQLLLLSRIRLDSLAGVFTNGFHKNTYNEIQELLTRSISDVRSLTQQLNPPLLAKAGLEAALGWLAKRMEADYSLQVNFADDGSAKPLNEEFRAILFQSARELLINVAKHAGTGKAGLVIGREADTLMLIVEDHGVGFPSPSDHDTHVHQNSTFGLFNIRQRIKYLGGKMMIGSAPGRGTRVTIHVPIMDDNSIGDEPSAYPV
jgi:PAS domain S-box-containing protein